VSLLIDGAVWASSAAATMAPTAASVPFVLSVALHQSLDGIATMLGPDTGPCTRQHEYRKNPRVYSVLNTSLVKKTTCLSLTKRVPTTASMAVTFT